MLTGLITANAIMLMVGPGKAPDPHGPERFLGFPNRLFMVAYGAWPTVAAWPVTQRVDRCNFSPYTTVR
jgi:hypothetical protein